MKTKREAIVSVLSRYDDGSELKKMEKFKIYHVGKVKYDHIKITTALFV